MPWPSIDVPFFRRIPWGSLRVRLTLLNSAAVLLAMLILLFAVRVGVRSALFNETEQTLLGEVRALAHDSLEAAALKYLDLRLGEASERRWAVHPMATLTRNALLRRLR